MKKKVFIIILYMIISALAMNKADSDQNLVMQGISIFGFILSIMYLIVIYLEWKMRF